MSASAERVRRYREKQRAEGKRLVQAWVLDTKSPQLAEECRREAQLIAESDKASDDLEFWEGIRDTRGWE